MQRTIARVIPAAALAAVFSLASVAGAQPETEWSQERVTAIAKQLADATEELKEALVSQPDTSIPIARERIQYELTEDVRLLANATRHLSNRLEKGAGRDETAPIVRRIGLLRRDAEENARKLQIQEPTFEKVTKAGDLLIQLAPYYRDDVVMEEAAE